MLHQPIEVVVVVVVLMQVLGVEETAVLVLL